MPNDPPPDTIRFPPFELDLRAGQLRMGSEAVRVRPKAFAVLQYLAQRPGALVSKEALLTAVWGGAAVSEDVVRLSIRELRSALGDRVSAPRFIETVPRRGYRFAAAVVGATQRLATRQDLPSSSGSDQAVVVGRRPECTEVARWVRLAGSGRRQIGFVTGEAGIGKTTVVEQVLRVIQETHPHPIRIARAHCVEQFGAGEPFLPVLEALTALCSGRDAPAVEASLRRFAPDWMLEAMLLDARDGAERGEQSSGAREQTLHQVANSLDALAGETLLVIVLEDVQWLDHSTLDLLSVIAQRRSPARMAILCTMRPTDGKTRGQPAATVKDELVRRRLCHEIFLGPLSPGEIGSYLAERLDGGELPPDLLRSMVERSGGNPLFLVSLVDHVLARRLLVKQRGRWQWCADDVPGTILPDELRKLIDLRVARYSAEDATMLEVASVIGRHFEARAVAAIAPELGDPGDVEDRCDGLVEASEMLERASTPGSPDGGASATYFFRQSLDRQSIYQRLGSARRRRLHQAIGEYLEARCGERAADAASELAEHFERSRDTERAVRYHGEAGEQAIARHAYPEAQVHLEAALRLLRAQPDTADRRRRELPLLSRLGSTRFATAGYADDGAAAAFARMRTLGEELDLAPVTLRAMGAQLLIHTTKAEMTQARVLGEETVTLAERLGDRWASANARLILGASELRLGEIVAAHHHAERVVISFGSTVPAMPPVLGIDCCSLLASTCAHLGRVGRSRALSRLALAHAARLHTPYHGAHAASFAAIGFALLRDAASARSAAAETAALASRHGLSRFDITARLVRAWCDVEEGNADRGLPSLQAAYDEYEATGDCLSRSLFSCLLAQAYLASGDVAGSRGVLDRALAFVAETGERLFEPEILRLIGLGLLEADPDGRDVHAPVARLERALAAARGMNARLLELRVATSLCRIGGLSRDDLARLVEQFGQDDDCADLRDASAVLGRRSSPRRALARASRRA